jgi:glutathione S-transferase
MRRTRSRLAGSNQALKGATLRPRRAASSCAAWCTPGIHPFLSRINSPPRVCDLPGPEESVRRLAQQQLFENYQIADDKLADREWFFDHFTAVDAPFFWCFRRGTQFNLDVFRARRAAR